MNFKAHFLERLRTKLLKIKIVKFKKETSVKLTQKGGGLKAPSHSTSTDERPPSNRVNFCDFAVGLVGDGLNLLIKTKLQ